MAATAFDDYVDAFRCRAEVLGADGEVVEAPGLVGFGTTDGHAAGRVLVLDDSSLDVLEEVVDRLRLDLVTVFDEAPLARERLEARGFVRIEDAAAMVRSHLDALPLVPLPPELTVQPVQRTDADPPGVAFGDALGAARRFDPADAAVPEDAIRTFLLTLPHARLLVAVDAEGAVRATAGSGVFGDNAVVIFVSTDPALRRRGIGSAMTARALEAAREEGATRACLDASELGEPIYQRLGFTTVGRTCRYVRAR